MSPLERLTQLLSVINTLQPIAESLISDLRNPGETDEEVIARARAHVAETRAITEEDMT